MKRVLMLLLAVIALFLGYAATRPNTYHVERSASIAAPPEVIYARIVDFHKWPDWSPWEKLDPAMKHQYSGTDGAVGAATSWVGNDKVGEGSMTLTEATPPRKVGIRLEFIKPFKSTSATAFALAPEAAGTRVTWSIDGNNNYMSKVMCIFVTMDKMMGGDFERGLATLKSQCEASGAASAPAAPANSTGTH